MEAMNVSIMDVDNFVKTHACGEVTSHYIHAPSSNNFSEDGLFSETIFGEVASDARMLRHGYISLNCRVLHPAIFQNIKDLKRMYIDILAGNEYAIWNAADGEFVRAAETDEGADTGFAFFLSHLNQIKWTKNNSLKRNDKIDVLNKFRDRLLITKCLVIPAGIRDLREENGRLEKNDINSCYLSLLTSCKAMPKNGDLDPIYDVIHYSIQRKVMEIYSKLTEMIEGKGGFFQSKFAYRHVVGGSRNVITATNLEAKDPSHPQYHKCDETKLPLYQAAKSFASLVLYQLKSLFYSFVVNDDTDNVALIDPTTLKLNYVQIDTKDKDFLVTEEGIQKTIDRCRDQEFRLRPVSAKSDGKLYYLFLVYDTGDTINIFRNLDEVKNDLGEKFNPKNVRPLSYCEMLYIATYYATRDRFCTVTRFPISDEQNIYPSRVHLMSTMPGRVVKFITNSSTGEGIQLPEYPILRNTFVDVVMFHPSKRAGLQGDYDGNCVTGDTTVDIRYTDLWLQKVFASDYSVSKQDINVVVETIKQHTTSTKDGFNYATIRMDCIPQPGQYVFDKNHAKVYDLPEGCECLSYFNSKPMWAPFIKVTVEENCEYCTLYVSGQTVNVSTNPSVAVFDTETAGLKKVTPKDAVSCFGYVPFIGVSVSEFYNENSIIPISDEERKQLIRLAQHLFLTEDISALCGSKMPTVGVLYKYCKYLDPNSSLKNRILTRNVKWLRVDDMSDVKTSTVYDIEVPESKVFAVNNGLIIFDTVSILPIWSNEACEECDHYLNDVSNYIFPNGSTMVGLDDLLELGMYAMTADTPDLK